MGEQMAESFKGRRDSVAERRGAGEKRGSRKESLEEERPPNEEERRKKNNKRRTPRNSDARVKVEPRVCPEVVRGADRLQGGAGEVEARTRGDERGMRDGVARHFAEISFP